jgi:hypothetical protein
MAKRCTLCSVGGCGPPAAHATEGPRSSVDTPRASRHRARDGEGQHRDIPSVSSESAARSSDSVCRVGGGWRARGTHRGRGAAKHGCESVRGGSNVHGRRAVTGRECHVLGRNSASSVAAHADGGGGACDGGDAI